MAHQREVMGYVAGASACVVIAKLNIQAPVETVLHFPVVSGAIRSRGEGNGRILQGRLLSLFPIGVQVCTDFSFKASWQYSLPVLILELDKAISVD